jgi:ribosome-associated protein
MDLSTVSSELRFKAVRSSGAGGQNVNKVSSKVILTFDVRNSNGLDDAEKELILNKLTSRTSSEGILSLACDEDRSQFRNKDIVIRRFISLITDTLKVVVPRKATKVPKSVIRKRLKDKKNHSDLKQSRRKPDY